MRCPKCGCDLELELAVGNGLQPSPEKTWRQLPLAKMELSVRSYNALKYDEDYRRDGLKTAGEIADLADIDLLRFTNFGRKGLREVRAIIARLEDDAE